jgi:hypothetical protein
MTLRAARQVADAVLYEGYLLYPYRATSSKNQVRWQFGVLGPVGAAAAGVGEDPDLSCDLLVGASGSVDICLRFLQVQSRVVEQCTDDGWRQVDALEVDGTRWIPYHEAVAREVVVAPLPLEGRSTRQITVPGGVEEEDLLAGGQVVGRLVRTRWPLSAELAVAATVGEDPRLRVLRMSLTNLAPWSGAADGWNSRDVAARQSFVGTHLLLTAEGSDFVSLLDPPDWAEASARTCVQHRCWPVLIAEDSGKDAVLVAPIILGDHPTIAPESAGDLFDATEIDEILTLRVMTMTDDERAAARGTDPRAAAILARCDAMTNLELSRLHGARRDEVPDEVPWWDEGQDSRAEPEADAVMVAGTPVRKGTRVLLRPSRRADAQDTFLAGLVGVVAKVYFDVDGGSHVAVTLEDDPAADLYDTTGRFYYFGPEELEPLPAKERTP